MRQQILQYISDNSLTVEQVKNITARQFNNAMETNLTEARIKNILRPIIGSMQRAENNIKLQGLKTKVNTWIKNNLGANAEIEVKHRPLHYIIWPDGIPEVIDE